MFGLSVHVLFLLKEREKLIGGEKVSIHGVVEVAVEA